MEWQLHKGRKKQEKHLPYSVRIVAKLVQAEFPENRKQTKPVKYQKKLFQKKK